MKNLLFNEKSVQAGIFYLILFYLTGCSFFAEETPLETALRVAQHNRKELEKVLNQYAVNPNDSFKLAAARFLIENMPYYYYYEGKPLDNQLTQYKAFALTNQHPVAIKDSLTKLYGRFSTASLTPKWDILEIDSAYLANNIEEAFKVWQEQPWGKNVSFPDFCEYILPYRIGDEKLPVWRKEIYEKYNPLLDSIRKLPEAEDPLFAARTLLELFYKEGDAKFTNDLAHTPHAGPQICVEYKSGSCRELSDAVVYVMRALGIPCGIDALVMRGDNNNSHFWNFFLSRTGRTYMTEFPRPDLYSPRYFTSPKGKVYRTTFSVNREMQKEMQALSDYVSPYFRIPKFVDVTPSYGNTFNLFISRDSLYTRNPKDKIIYLSMVCYQDWLPAAWTENKGENIRINGVEGGIVYRFTTWGKEGEEPLSDPFYVDWATGDARFIRAKKEMEEVTLFFKFHFFYEFFRDRIINGVVEGSHSADFSRPDTLYQIKEAPNRLTTTVYPESDQKYRYVRYKGPKGSHCNISELSLYENTGDSIVLEGKIIGTPGCFQQDGSHEYTNVFDKDPYTSFDYKDSDNGWSGLDLGTPCYIRKLSYAPRNRDNYVRIGDAYELFYFDKEWISAGRQTATSDSLNYTVPKGALLYLKNHTRGRDERIFEYIDKKQIIR